jgi:AAA ATPase domain
MSNNEYASAAADALLGRSRELAKLGGLAQSATGAAGGALVLRGEAGVGKTALLTEFARLAGECRVLQLPGVEAEAGMPWAALHRLLLSFPAELNRLPPAQREAVDTAFGTGTASADARLVESATRMVLADAALVCVVDDLQWIDRESRSVLHAIARGSGDLPLTLLAAVREPAPTPVLADVPEIAVAGLPADAGADLLLREAGAVLDRRTAEQLALLTDGSPLTLTETGRKLARGQSDVIDILCGQRLGGLYLPGTFAAEIRALPEPTRALLMLAACDTGSDPRRLWQAARALQLGPEALAPARRANVV